MYYAIITLTLYPSSKLTLTLDRTFGRPTSG